MKTYTLEDNDQAEMERDRAELDDSVVGFDEALKNARIDGIPDLCAIYRGTIRGPLEIVRRIVCRRWLKFVIGSTPCDVITKVIEFLDGLCPANS